MSTAAQAHALSGRIAGGEVIVVTRTGREFRGTVEDYALHSPRSGAPFEVQAVTLKTPFGLAHIDGDAIAVVVEYDGAPLA